jgi:hypothetical protein
MGYGGGEGNMQCMKKISRKRKVSKKIISGVMVAAMTVSGIWLPGKVQTVYGKTGSQHTKRVPPMLIL